MFGDQTAEGPQSGPQTNESKGRRRHGCGPGNECGPARFRFGGRGEGGRGGGKGPGKGHGHGPGFGGPGRGRGPWARARRGDVRAAILLALAGEPMHGYQIMQQLEERSGGAWRPSPGSVYPTLQLLEDQELIKGEEAEGKRVFSLTEAGAAEAAAVKERLGDTPFGGEGGEKDPRFALYQAVIALHGATKQVGMTGSADDVQKALEIVRDARKRLYSLLADAE
jgi:DNA-binding PadR family transcriptional regulator